MEHVNQILLVDDDREIRELVSGYLRKNGFRVVVAGEGQSARTVLDTQRIDAVILDIMMPGEDGLMICREIRSGKQKNIPILMLTARADEADRLLGLEMGADDYLVKPFTARELLARLNAVLRRTRMMPPNMRQYEANDNFTFGAWTLDTVKRHLVRYDGAAVPLSGGEYRLLKVFLDHPHRVLNRDQLLNLTQGRVTEVFDRSIDLLVSRLRQRLNDDAREPLYIKTVRSEGYVFAVPIQASGSR